MKKKISILLLTLLLFSVSYNINAYYLPPFTFKKGTLLLKLFDSYGSFKLHDSFFNAIGFKEQFGLTDNINIYALQPIFLYKKVGPRSNKGIGDFRQGVMFRLFNFKKKNNILFIVTLKVPTGYSEKSKYAKLPLGTGTYDVHMELLGNYFYKLFEIRYYISFIRKLGKGIYDSDSEEFITLCEHLFKNRLTLLTTYIYDYSFNTRKQNTTISEELLYKFSKKNFLKAGLFLPVVDNNKIKSRYKLLFEFYYFFNS